MGYGSALISRHIRNPGLQKSFGNRQDPFAAKLLALTEIKLLNFFLEEAFCHCRRLGSLWHSFATTAIASLAKCDFAKTVYVSTDLPAFTSASTRHGLPEPLTIFNGGVTSIAPFGGSRSKFARLANPNFPLPCMRLGHGKGGLNRNA